MKNIDVVSLEVAQRLQKAGYRIFANEEGLT